MIKKKTAAGYFSKAEIALWCSSTALIVISFCIFDRKNYLTLFASLIGVTSLIFNAKGNPFGQFLMVVFSLLYGIISFTFAYYGEMITYLGMTMPMAIFADHRFYPAEFLCRPLQGFHAGQDPLRSQQGLLHRSSRHVPDAGKRIHRPVVLQLRVRRRHHIHPRGFPVPRHAEVLLHRLQRLRKRITCPRSNRQSTIPGPDCGPGIDLYKYGGSTVPFSAEHLYSEENEDTGVDYAAEYQKQTGKDLETGKYVTQ